MSVKVTVHETPTEQVLAEAASTVSIRDAQGRVIVLKKPGILAQYRIIEVAGESSKNEVYMRMVLPLIYVTELDGIPISQPANKLQLESLIQRLDESGVEAVMKGVGENFGSVDPEGDKSAVKK